MLPEKIRALCQRLCQTARIHEPVCLTCLEPLENSLDLEGLFAGSALCARCRRQFEWVQETYFVDGLEIYVIQAYTPFLERLFFQYKEGHDVALAPVFLPASMKRRLKRHPLCVLPSWWEKGLERGFEPVPAILAAHGLSCLSPFAKLENVKQSARKKEERQKISGALARKDLARIPADAVLIDDVLTTGSSLFAAAELSGIKKAVVLSAHPKWLEAHSKCKGLQKREGGFFC